MQRRDIFFASNFLLTLGLLVYLVIKSQPEKKGYVVNQQIFEGFQGKKDLEARLAQLRTDHKRSLDSILTLIRAENRDRFEVIYKETANQYVLKEKEISEKYTADIWKQINHSIAAYGKEYGYDFILGASGDGNLMFAKESNNITEDVVRYMNAQYEEN